MWELSVSQLFLLIMCSCQVLISYQQQVFQQEPVPDPFRLGDRYPDRDEAVECRPIKLRLRRTSARFSETIVRNTNNDLDYDNDDARFMTSRLKSRLDILGELYRDRYRRKLRVILTYAEEGHPGISSDSLHFEGRTARIKGNSRSELRVILELAVQAGFDWVFYADRDYCRVSVIPDVCQTNLDLLFLLDQSGSVGQRNHDLALDFMEAVVNFFDVGPDQTRVGVFTFSTGARTDFFLDRHLTTQRVTNAIDDIRYRDGWTHTALALDLATQAFNNPSSSGARRPADGIPRVVVLITDGRSNTYSITQPARNLLASGVTVYSVGVGNVDVNELRFIASDPDSEHVFLLRSFSDAAAFVQLLSGTTCDTPANIPPGTDPEGECDEDDFRYFQVECPAFTEMVIIEQLDLVGICALYASATIVNPSPVDPTTVTYRNETFTISRRTLIVRIDFKKIVYVAVRGIAEKLNRFRMSVYSMLFDQDVYTAEVASGIQVNNIIDLDIIMDDDSLYIFEITEGNEDGRFSIGRRNGIISTVSPLNAQQQDFYNLTIIAYLESNDCKRGRAYVEITVTANNQNPPVFQPINPVDVLETVDVGTSVVQVTADDADFGINGEVRYSITGGNLGNAFSINPTTGEVSVAAALNHAIRSSYDLSVTATDQATSNPMSATATQRINVIDVNERPFFITSCAIQDTCQFSVSEGEAINTVLETISADDPDLDSTPNGQLDFILDPSDTQFTINNDGQISLSSTVDREMQDRYIFLLRVNDRGNPPLGISARVTFIVTDINDNAPTLVAPDEVDVSELEPVNEVVAQVSAFDADINENAAVTFFIMGSPFFNINEGTGDIVLVQSLDFETTMQHIVTVHAENPDGLSSDNHVITFNVINENDNSPIFTMDPYTASVAEHSNASTPVVTVQAGDADLGIFGEVVYSVESGNSGRAFRINATSGEISVNNDIDRESITSFTLVVRAHDRGDPSRSDRANVEITITDINDNSPIFLPSLYFTSVSENAEEDAEVITVTATDADEPGNPNSMIEYSITTGNVGDAFSITPDTGVITVNASLDFETFSEYILTVTASDQGEPTRTGIATVNITVIDINDVPPQVSGNQTIILSELTPVPSPVAQFVAGGEIGDNLVFSLIGNQNGEFEINSANGIVTLVRSLDFETTEGYTFEVQVDDGAFTTSSFLTVIVLDENDNAPQFGETGPFMVTEELPVGTVVGQVTATDDDSGVNGEFDFSIVSSAGGRFDVNASSGIITTTIVLDREALADMNLFVPPGSQQLLTIQAEDRGSPSLFTQVDVTVILADINDNSPQFGDVPSAISFPENIPVNTFILDASATDADIGPNGEITYSLSSSMSPLPFTIDPSTGAVSTSATLDREETDMYEFEIIARDNGTPRMSSAVMISLNVTDVNDNAPIFNGDPPFIVEFFEGDFFDGGGSVELQRLFATDQDIGRNAEIDFSLSPGTDSRFSIRTNPFDMTAQLLVSGAINFEGQGLFNVTVIATDRGEPPMSTIATLFLIIQDTDEFLPVFRGPCNASIPETFPVGTEVVTQCTADDRDGDFVFYDIPPVFGNPALTTFRLNRESGELFLQDSVDRESLDFYEFTFTASSGGTMIAQMTVRIDITDVNDNAPVITPRLQAIPYSDPSTRDIVRFTIADADINENGEFSTNISSISRTTRSNGLDSHNIVITAVDMGTPPMSGSATVIVSNAFPCEIMEFSLDPDTFQLSVATLCSLSNPPVSQDYLLGTPVTLDCSAVSNLPVTYQWQRDGSFITNPSADPVLDLGEIGFDDAGSYSCIARNDVGNIQSLTAAIAVKSASTIIRPPEEMSVEIDRLVTIPCVAVGEPTPTVEFLRNGVVIVPDNTRVLQSGQFLIISRATIDDEGLYSCRAENSAGTATSAEARLIIFRPENVVSTAIQLNNPNSDGTCHNLDANLVEELLEESTGLSVEVTSVTAESGFCDSGPCYPNPCLNDGECSLNANATDGFECTCPEAYTGRLCGDDVDECTVLEPCLFGGSCTNTRGSFTCACPADRRGYRCQYQILCVDDSLCDDNETCVETLANSDGYVCDSTLVDMSLQVTLSDGRSIDELSEAVYNLNDELNNLNRGTTKRQTSTSDDFCEPRFLPTNTPSIFQQVWACPNGTTPPGMEALQLICDTLLDNNVVDSCVYPDGSTQTSTTGNELEPISVDVVLILLSDSNGNPISGNEAVQILNQAGSLSALMAAGLTANQFEAGPSSEESDGGGLSGGAIAGIIIIGVLLAVAVVAIIIVIIIYTNSKRGNKNIENGAGHTAKHLQAPMLHTPDAKFQTLSTTGVIDNPAYKYKSPKVPMEDQPRITKLDGNTEAVDKSAINRLHELDRATSTDNLLQS